MESSQVSPTPAAHILNDSTIDYRGYKVPKFPGVQERLDDFSNKFQSREDDIWLCGYPKAGTHWTNEVVHMLKTNSLQRAPNKESFFVEFTHFREWDNVQSPRVLNTHLPFQLLPECVRSNRIILFVRNLKDIAVSMYNHLVNLPIIKPEMAQMKWEEFIEYFVTENDANTYYRQWADVFCKSDDLNLLACRDSNFVTPIRNVMLISYEEMKENPLDHVIKIARFLNFERDLDLYKAIVEKTDIKAMKADRGDEKIIVKIDQPPAGHPNEMEIKIGLLYRKGIIGDWKNWFTEDQNARFNCYYKEQLGDLKFGVEKYME